MGCHWLASASCSPPRTTRWFPGWAEALDSKPWVQAGGR
jgi:hypothetical protein